MPIVPRSGLVAVHQATRVVLLKNHLVRIARQLPADTEPISLHPVLGKNACLPAIYVKVRRTTVVAGRGTDLQGKLLVNASYGPFVSTTRMHLAPNLVHGDSSGRGSSAPGRQKVSITIVILHLSTIHAFDFFNPVPEGYRFARVGLVVSHVTRIIQGSFIALTQNQLLDRLIPRYGRRHGGQNVMGFLPGFQ